MNIKLVAEKTFNLLKGFGYEVSSYNREGDLVIDPMEATRFAVESPNILVRIDPLDKHLSLKTGTPGEAIEKIRPMLKELAQDYLLDFDYSVFDKQIKPKGEKLDVAKKSKEEDIMSEEFSILRKLAGIQQQEMDESPKYIDGFMGADGKPTSKPTAKDYASNKEFQDMKKKLGDRIPQPTKRDKDGKLSPFKKDDLEENPLMDPPGSKLKFGQDRNEKLPAGSDDTKTMVSNAMMDIARFNSEIANMFKDGKLVGADNRPVQKIEPETLSMAYQFHKDGEANPISAYAQASAKQTMGYRSGDFSEAESVDNLVPMDALRTFEKYRDEVKKNYGQEGLDYYSDIWHEVKKQRGAKANAGEAYRLTVQQFAGKELTKPLNIDVNEVKMISTNVGQLPVTDQNKMLTWQEYADWEESQGETDSNKISLRYGVYQTDYEQFVESKVSIEKLIAEASLGKMTGSRKSSYQPLADSVKIIVRHNKDVNEEVRGARSRNIHSILIQRGEEKFKMAENNLSAARAMARHLHNGGETFDEIGESITEMSREFKKLKEFIGYVRKAKLVNETNQEFVSMALENIDTIRTNFKRLSGVKSYANAVESVSAYNNVELLQDDIDLESKFTETHFDDKVANAMESLKAMTSRRRSFESKITKAIESETFAGLKNLLAEDDLMEFEDINQQLSHKVSSLGNTAKDETLGNYLHSISNKLNAGGQLSQFEYGAIKSSLLSAGQHNVQSAPMSMGESYEAFMDRFVE